MKKIWMLGLLMVMYSSLALAGSITLNYPEGQKARILEGLTSNGKACNEGEALGPCAKRVLKRTLVDIVRSYEQKRDAEVARDAVVKVDIT